MSLFAPIQINQALSSLILFCGLVIWPNLANAAPTEADLITVFSLAHQGVPLQRLKSEAQAKEIDLTKEYLVKGIRASALDYVLKDAYRDRKFLPDKIRLLSELISIEHSPWTDRSKRLFNRYIDESEGKLWRSIFATKAFPFVVSAIRNSNPTSAKKLALLWILKNGDLFTSLFPSSEVRFVIAALSAVGSFKYQKGVSDFDNFMDFKAEEKDIFDRLNLATLNCNNLPLLAAFLSNILRRDELRPTIFSPLSDEEPFFSQHTRGIQSADFWAMYHSVNSCVYRGFGRNKSKPHFVADEDDIRSFLELNETSVAFLFFTMSNQTKLSDVRHISIVFIDPITGGLSYINIDDNNVREVEETQFSIVGRGYNYVDIAPADFAKKDMDTARLSE